MSKSYFRETVPAIIADIRARVSKEFKSISSTDELRNDFVTFMCGDTDFEHEWYKTIRSELERIERLYCSYMLTESSEEDLSAMTCGLDIALGILEMAEHKDLISYAIEVFIFALTKVQGA